MISDLSLMKIQVGTLFVHDHVAEKLELQLYGVDIHIS